MNEKNNNLLAQLLDLNEKKINIFKIIGLTKLHKLHFLLMNLIFQKINKYSFSGEQTSYGATVAHLDMFGDMKDFVFIDDSTSNGSDLGMHPNGRNEAPMVVGVVESSKSHTFDLGEILRCVRSK